MKEFDRVGIVREDLGGRGAGEELGGQGDQAEHDRRVGVGAKMAEALAKL